MHFRNRNLHRLFSQHSHSWLEKMWSYTALLSNRVPHANFLYQHLSWLLSSYDPTISFLRGNRWMPRVSYHLSKVEEEVSKWHKIEPHKNHIRAYPFPVAIHYPFQKQHVFGMVIAIRTSFLNRFLSHDNLEQAISVLLPDFYAVSGSIVSHRNPTNSVNLFYFEVKKERGKYLSCKEKRILTYKLPEQLERYLRPQVPPLIVSHNEEEALKGIVTLSQELTQQDDIPQLILRFHQAESDHLLFTAILVRLLTSTAPSIESLEKNLPPGITWETERINGVGFLKQTPKEAVSLILRFPHRLFQINGAIDLRKARQFLFQVFQNLFGKIRDYNGGWMSRQEETLNAVQQHIDSSEAYDLHLLEHFFYSITPRIFQSYISPKLLAEAFSFTNTALTHSLSASETWRILNKSIQNKDIILVLAKDPSYLAPIAKLVDPLHHGLVSTRVSLEGITALVVINLQLDRPAIDLWITAMRNALKNKEQEMTRQQTLRLSIQRVTSSLDPRLRSDRRSGPLMNLLYEGLMRLDCEGNPTFGLAEKVEISPDKCHYTFYLRKSSWSNGKPVTARDFVYGWKKVLDPSVKIPFSHLFYCIKGAQLAKAGKIPLKEVSISANGDHILNVTLEFPSPHFLAYTTFWSFAPLYHEIDHLLPAWAFDSNKNFPCNGPFLPTKLEPKSLELIKNPHYHKKSEQHFDKIKVYQPENRDEAISLWKEGHLDWVGDPLCPIHLRKSKSSPIPLDVYPTMATSMLYFNTQSAPFDNVLIRQQVAQAIHHRAPQLSNTFPKGANPTNLYVSPKMGLSTKPPHFSHQLDPIPIPLQLIYPAPDQSEEMCNAIAKYLEKEFQTSVAVQAVDWDTFCMDGFAQNGAHIGISVWYPFCLDPMCYLDPFTSNTPANISQWQSPLYNQLLQEANRAPTSKQRLALFTQAEESLLKNAPIVPLYQHAHLYAKKERIKGNIMTPIGTLNLRDVYVETYF